MDRHYPDFLQAYLNYTKKQESPEDYHRWTAIGIVSSALARKCWLHRGYYTLFPNTYIVLVGESAWCRKTTAAEIGLKILANTNKVDILYEKITNAYLCRHLANAGVKSPLGDSSITIYAPELSNCLGKDAYNSGLISNLTSAYTCPDTLENRTKTAGIDVIRNVCINFLGATTMEWMSQNLPGDAVEGGFTGRVVFIVKDESRHREAWPALTPEEMTMRDYLVHDLSKIACLNGEFKFTDKAKEIYKYWYDHAVEPEDMRLRPYFGRKGDHVLKISMIMSVFKSDDLIVTDTHVEEALSSLHHIEEMMPHAFRGVAFSKSSKDTDRVLRQLEKMGGTAAHSLLLKKNYHYVNGTEFEEVIKTLMASDVIEAYMDGKKTYYKIIKTKRREL